MQKEAFEATGLIPRSIIRTFERFLQQLLPGSETIAIREYRLSRYQIRVSIKSLFQLICIPLLVNYTVKPFLVRPVVQYVWDSRQQQLFLNHDQQKQAFRELHNFSETLFFDALLQTPDPLRGYQGGLQKSLHPQSQTPEGGLQKALHSQSQDTHIDTDVDQFSNNAEVTYPVALRSKLSGNVGSCCEATVNKLPDTLQSKRSGNLGSCCKATDNTLPDALQTSWLRPADFVNKARQQSCQSLSPPYSLLPPYGGSGYAMPLESKDQTENFFSYEALEAKKAYQLKSLEIAQRYNTQSILAITNVFGDLLTFVTVSLLFVLMRAQIIILQSFLTEFIYSLSDTSKSFLLILGMDLLVGFHSPRAWELALQALLAHVGLPENENFILLFVALFPVFLDTVFKYWIFRYLNKISPSTVVTYHSMLE